MKQYLENTSKVVEELHPGYRLTQKLLRRGTFVKQISLIIGCLPKLATKHGYTHQSNIAHHTK